MKGIIVAIDGPAGAGKSTVSRQLASDLGYHYVDTGAMYRIIGVLATERDLDLANSAALARLCDQTAMEFTVQEGKTRVLADGRDMSAAIRTPQAAQQASKVSAVSALRERLVAKQREMGAGGGVVMEGRDIGTVVFPNAALKVFLSASVGERARRRACELHETPTDAEVARIAAEIAERDDRDQNRADSPLRPAADAILIDTTKKSIEEVVQELRALATTRAANLASHS